jgi:effector-binding domain-containing protein
MKKSLKAEQKGGKVSKRKSLPISKKERAKVTHDINDVYHTRFDGKSNCVIHNGNYTYLFENHGFDNYNIYFKMAIDEED